MDIHPETMISETSSSRITTRSTHITDVRRFQVPNGDDLSGAADIQAYLLVQVDRIRRWIRQFSLPPIDTNEIHVIPLQFSLDFRTMCSNIKGYLNQELEPLLLQGIIPQDFWDEFIDTLTSNYKTILSEYNSVITRRKSGEVELLRVDVEVVNEECFDAQLFLEHYSQIETSEFDDAAAAALTADDIDDDDSFRETPASQDSIDALESMTYEQSRYVKSGGDCCDGDQAYDESSRCSICLNEYLNASMIKWMPCSHMFHSDCIEGWLKKKNTCPLCRFEMFTSKP